MTAIKMTEQYHSVMTEWRPVVGFESWYEVSEEGVRSLRLGKMLSPSKGGKGRYVTYGLRGQPGTGQKTRTFHSLLADAFLGPRPEGMMVLHRDDNRHNNTLKNLYYGTPSDNNHDAVRNGKNHQANKETCPRNHPLNPPNLTKPSKRQPIQRTCLACRDARNILRARPHLDLITVADACYQEIVNGTENPYRRTISQAHHDNARNGAHQMTRRTHCPRGHRLEGPNLEPWNLKRGYRSCLSCHCARSMVKYRPGNNFLTLANEKYQSLGMV